MRIIPQYPVHQPRSRPRPKLCSPLSRFLIMVYETISWDLFINGSSRSYSLGPRPSHPAHVQIWTNNPNRALFITVYIRRGGVRGLFDPLFRTIEMWRFPIQMALTLMKRRLVPCPSYDWFQAAHIGCGWRGVDRTSRGGLLVSPTREHSAMYQKPTTIQRAVARKRRLIRPRWLRAVWKGLPVKGTVSEFPESAIDSDTREGIYINGTSRTSRP